MTFADPTSPPPMILVLGVTGVGKSTFILSAGPKDKLPIVHHGLASAVAPVTAFEVTKDKRSALLVDTPGFNDTERSDKQVLKDIIAFLNSAEESQKVAGVIYLLDTSNREYTPVAADKLEHPPSIVLATVHQCHTVNPTPDSDILKDTLQKKYGDFYLGDHFDTQSEGSDAWVIINRVIDQRIEVPVREVIRNLERILPRQVKSENGVTKSRYTFLRRIFSAFRK